MNAGWTPTRGDDVLVDGLGRAKIVRLDKNQAIVSLADSHLEIEVSCDELRRAGRATAESEGPSPRPTQPGPPRAGSEPQQAGDRKRFQNRKSLEALRFGLVPVEAIEGLTLGYEELQDWVRSRLPDRHGGEPQVSEISGPFGSGKSHTMAAIRHIARKDGYATARVEVDGQFVTLSNPERLLHALWNTLGAGDHESSTPLLDLTVKAIEAGQAAPFIAPRGIDRVRDNYSTARLLLRSHAIDTWGYALDSVMASSDEFTASEVARDISREPTIRAFEVKVRRMIGQKVDERPYDFVEAWVGYAMLSKLAGYKGLVITIDEFEVEHFQASGGFQRVAALLEVLTRYFNRTLDHPAAPVCLFFATVGEEGHHGDRVVDELVENTGGDYYDLSVWSREERADLAQRIHALYCDVFSVRDEFSMDAVETVEQRVELEGDSDSGLIRAFIKTYVGTLDSVYRPVPSA